MTQHDIVELSYYRRMLNYTHALHKTDENIALFNSGKLVRYLGHRPPMKLCHYPFIYQFNSRMRVSFSKLSPFCGFHVAIGKTFDVIYTSADI